MPFVFTVFNHGTDFNADKNHFEIVTFLHNLMPKAEEAHVDLDEATGRYVIKNAQFATYMINMGVGSESVEAKNSTRGYGYATPGTLNPFTGAEKTATSPHNPGFGTAIFGGVQSATVPRKGSLFQEAQGDTFKTDRDGGRLFGLGWDDNIAKALDIICDLSFEHGRRPDAINLVGWSRGAVTALRIANALFNVFHYEIPINVFAVDPVPGGKTERTETQLNIPPNVANYLAIIALDDIRANFQPTDRADIYCRDPREYGTIPTGGKQIAPPNVHFLPLPGNHSCVAGAFSDISKAHPAMRNIANLVRHLGIKYLSAHGTPLQMGSYIDPMESAEDVLFYYQFIKQCIDPVREKSKPSGLTGKVAGGGEQVRPVRENDRRNHVFNPEKYLNDHEEYCTDLVEKRAARDSGASAYGSRPSTYQANPKQSSLNKMGITYSNSQIIKPIKDPQFKRMIETRTYFTNENMTRIMPYIVGTDTNNALLLSSSYNTAQKMMSA